MDAPTTSPDVESDPILRLIATGEAGTLWEAEELYLDRSLPEIYRLFGGELTDDELLKHPLMHLLEAHSDPRAQPLYAKVPGELADPPPRP